MEALGIKWVPEVRSIDQLKNWDKNPRRITEQAYYRLKKKIVEEGMHQVLTIDTDNTVLSGNQRLQILRELGVKEVHCMVPERTLTEDERDKVGIQSNIIEGTWDTELLSEKFDVPMLLDQGFTKLQLGMKDLHEDDFDAEKEMAGVKPIPQYGDIFELGGHRIGCLDSTKIEDVEALMGEGKARLVFTDPPYSVDYKSSAGNSYSSGKFGNGNKIFNDDKSEEEATEFYTKILKNLYAVTTDDATIYWWYANNKVEIPNQLAFRFSGWKVSQILIWIKNSMVFAMGSDYHRQYEPCIFGWKEGKTHFKNKIYAKFKDVFNLDHQDFVEMFDVWYEKRDNTQEYIHPTQKPIRLADRALKKHSEIGDIVLDLFAGSGSTLMGCEMGGRKCRTMDLDPKYVHAVIKRYMKYKPDAQVKCLTREVDMKQFVEPTGGQ